MTDVMLGVTWMLAKAPALGAFTAETVAVLLYVPVEPEVVALLTCTEADAPAASVVMVQPRACEPTAPVTEQVPGPE